MRRSVLLCAAGAGLAMSAPPAQATFPGVNGKIAFESDRDGGDVDIFTMAPDRRSTAVNLTADSDAFDADANWSPDGRRIVFISDRKTRSNPEGDIEIFVMNADGSRVKQLTSNAVAGDGNPTWSPDGRKIAFARLPDPEINESDIWTMNADGGGERRVTNLPGHDAQPDWSPDGRQIVFSHHRDGEFDDLYLVDPSGAHLRRLTATAYNEDHPVWSPDGRLIAYDSDQQGPLGGFVFNVYTMRSDGSHPTALTLAARGEQGLLPAWSPDGRKIVFISDRSGDPELWTMRADGSRQHNLSNNPAWDDFPAWQPLGANERPGSHDRS